MPACPPISSTASRKSASRASSTSVFPASTPSPGCSDELERAQNALSERKVIDRAKGILMKAQESQRGRRLCPAAQDGDEREQEDRRGRAVGRHRGGAAANEQRQPAHRLYSARRRGGVARRGRQGICRRRRLGLSLELVREVSWSNVRDKLNHRAVRRRASVGAGRDRVKSRHRPSSRCRSWCRLCSALNGNAITVSPALYSAHDIGGRRRRCDRSEGLSARAGARRRRTAQGAAPIRSPSA